MEQPSKRVFSDANPAEDAPRGRDSLFLASRLRLDGKDRAVEVRVRNLSAGGLMAELPHPLPPDQTLEVEVRGIGWVRGRIAWQTEGRVGIAFDHEIDPQLARKPVAGGTPGRKFTPGPRS